MEQPLIGTTNRHLAFVMNAGAAFLCAIFIIASLGVHRWCDYCFWEFGLEYADNLSQASFVDNPNNIEDVQTDICDGGPVEIAVELICHDFCSNLDNIQAAGILMIIGGVAALVHEVILGVLLVIKWIKDSCSFKWAWLLGIIGAGIYLGSFILYLIVLDPTNIDNPEKAKNLSAKDYTAKTGTILAIFTCFLLIGHIIIAIFFTRKLLNS